jgi:hypothetical protein
MDTFLYDEAEHFIAGVTVLHLRARFEIERLGLEQIDELYDGHLRAHHLGEVVRNSRLVGKEVLDADVLPCGRTIGKILRGQIVYAELALLREL